MTAKAATTSDFGGVFGEPLELASMVRRPSGDPAFDHVFASFAESARRALSRAHAEHPQAPARMASARARGVPPGWVRARSGVGLGRREGPRVDAERGAPVRREGYEAGDIARRSRMLRPPSSAPPTLSGFNMRARKLVIASGLLVAAVTAVPAREAHAQSSSGGGQAYPPACSTGIGPAERERARAHDLPGRQGPVRRQELRRGDRAVPRRVQARLLEARSAHHHLARIRAEGRQGRGAQGTRDVRSSASRIRPTS